MWLGDPNRRAVLVGAAVTAVTTAVLFVLPDLLPMEAMRRAWWERTGDWVFGNPFRNLRFLGGLPGGLVAGYLTRNEINERSPAWGVCFRNGLLAGFGGVAALYLAYVGYQLVRTSVLMGVFPPPVYLIAVVPLVLLLPFAFTFVVQAIATALVGHALYLRN